MRPTTADSETLADLHQHNWSGERTINRLTTYAYGVADRYRWRNGSGEILTAGHDAVDFVMVAIEKLLSGERTWNRARHPALIDALKSIIDSLIYNAVHSKEQRTTDRMSDESDDRADYGGEPLDPFGDEWVEDSDPAERERIAWADQAKIDAFVAAAYQVTVDDPTLRAILDGLLHDRKPRQLAADLDLPIQDIYVLKRKLVRRVEQRLGPNDIHHHS